MKKLVFAIQVFGLITMFPVYVVMELNAVKSPATFNNAPSFIGGKPAHNSKKNVLISEVDHENGLFGEATLFHIIK